LKKKREMSENVTLVSKKGEYDEFRISTLINAKENFVAAQYLSNALKTSYIANLSHDEVLFEKAIKLVSDAKSISPDYIEIYRVGGFIYAAKDDYVNAEDCYTKGLSIDSNFPSLLYYYSGFLNKYGEYQQAYEYAEKLYLLRPNKFPVVSLLSECLIHLNRLDDAIKKLEDAYTDVSNTTPKNIMKLSQQLIKTYLLNSKFLIENNRDYNKALNYLNKGVAIIETQIKERQFDGSLIAFGERLISYMIQIPNSFSKDYTYNVQKLIKNNSGVFSPELVQKISSEVKLDL